MEGLHKIYVVCGCVLLFMTGCQSAPDENAMNVDAPSDTHKLAQPYSRGPSAPPSTSVRGPTEAPPEAVTEVDDITITLPES